MHCRLGGNGQRTTARHRGRDAFATDDQRSGGGGNECRHTRLAALSDCGKERRSLLRFTQRRSSGDDGMFLRFTGAAVCSCNISCCSSDGWAGIVRPLLLCRSLCSGGDSQSSSSARCIQTQRSRMWSRFAQRRGCLLALTHDGPNGSCILGRRCSPLLQRQAARCGCGDRE